MRGWGGGGPGQPSGPPLVNMTAEPGRQAASLNGCMTQTEVKPDLITSRPSVDAAIDTWSTANIEGPVRTGMPADWARRATAWRLGVQGSESQTTTRSTWK